jgi:hypothetical protein
MRLTLPHLGVSTSEAIKALTLKGWSDRWIAQGTGREPGDGFSTPGSFKTSHSGRLLHRATVGKIKVDSYRMKEKRLTGLFPGSIALPVPAKPTPRPKTK